MVESAGKVADHAKPLHQPPRAPVGRGGDRDDLGEAEAREPVLDHRPRRLERDAAPPKPAREAPGNLNRRGEMRRPGDAVEPDHPGKFRLARHFDDPLAIAVLAPKVARPGHPFVAPGAVEGAEQQFRDLGIGRHRGEGVGILVAPLAQQEARGAQRQRHFLPAIPKNISWSR
jgi:hypothetical protein